MAAAIYLKGERGSTLEEARAAMAKAYAMAVGRCVTYGIVTAAEGQPPVLTARGQEKNRAHLRHTYAGKTRLFDALHRTADPTPGGDVSGRVTLPETIPQLRALEDAVMREDIEL